MRPPISPTDPLCSRHSGFTLIEVVCTLAIIALLTGLMVPKLYNGSAAELRSTAVAAATMLKTDRNAAILHGSVVSTEVAAEQRFIKSGSQDRLVNFPKGMKVDALLANRCGDTVANGRFITFFPDGLSCGGVITLEENGRAYQIKVNWLTGDIELAPLEQS